MYSCICSGSGDRRGGDRQVLLAIWVCIVHTIQYNTYLGTFKGPGSSSQVPALACLPIVNPTCLYLPIPADLPTCRLTSLPHKLPNTVKMRERTLPQSPFNDLLSLVLPITKPGTNHRNVLFSSSGAPPSPATTTRPDGAPTCLPRFDTPHTPFSPQLDLMMKLTYIKAPGGVWIS